MEATEKIGAGRYERTRGPHDTSEGELVELLSTQAGDGNLQIPKLRQGSLFPSLLESRRRIDEALWAVVMTPTSTASRPARSTTWSRR